MALPTKDIARPDDPWRFETPREEIAPRAWRENGVRIGGKPALALSGAGKPYADGRWVRTVPVQPGAHYRFEARFRAERVREVERSVQARLFWLDAAGKPIGQAEYPATAREKDARGWQTLGQTYRSPAGAAQAKLELNYRWDGDGTVFFSEASLEKAAAPAPRIARLATVRYRPKGPATPEENVRRFCDFVARAAARKADIVCLPEGITIVSTGKSYLEVGEPVPGPTTRMLGDCARANRVYIVAGLLEKDGPALYNTAVLIGRDGKLAGKYRKVCLPREEIDGGVTPGEALPVFDTDFGRIGMLICWDLTFPEAAWTLGQQGAEAIFVPVWGYIHLLAPARAIENQAYVVTSSYDDPTGVYDREGKLVTEATDENPIVLVEADLNLRQDWPWLGDLRSRLPREKPSAKATRPPV